MALTVDLNTHKTREAAPGLSLDVSLVLNSGSELSSYSEAFTTLLLPSRENYADAGLAQQITSEAIVALDRSLTRQIAEEFLALVTQTDTITLPADSAPVNRIEEAERIVAEMERANTTRAAVERWSLLVGADISDSPAVTTSDYEAQLVISLTQTSGVAPSIPMSSSGSSVGSLAA